MQPLLDFVAGAAAANAIPHLVKGITGQRHMTPFARSSSAAVNVIWAFVNVLLSLVLLQLADRRGIAGSPLFECHERGDRLPLDVVGLADDGGFRDRRMIDERAL